MKKNGSSLNRRLFACLDSEFQLLPDRPGVTYRSHDALFMDDEGNQRKLSEFYMTNCRVLCPLHPDEPAAGYIFEELSSSLGFRCLSCNTVIWSILPWQTTCEGCGLPDSPSSFNAYGRCQLCDDDYSDAASGWNFAETDVDISMQTTAQLP